MLPATDGRVAAVLCSDVCRHTSLSVESVRSELTKGLPQLQVVELQDLCAPFSGFFEAVRAVGAGRVVVGCHQARTRRQKILNSLISGGFHPSGLAVVDLMPADGTTSRDVAEQSIARLRAAVARVSHSDLGIPVRDGRTASTAARLSRRELFGFGYLDRHPVASWVGRRCCGHGPSRPCVAACTHGALSVAGSSVSVDASACTGCGACVIACPSGAMALTGACVSGLEASAGALVRDARRLGVGVAFRCSKAGAEVPLGRQWLGFDVPSLQMVTAGWVLQFVAAGVAVQLVGCDDEACATRGVELARFSTALLGEIAPARRDMIAGAIACSQAVPRTAEAPPTIPAEVGPFGGIELREPRATTEAIAVLTTQISAATEATRPTVAPTRAWRFESPVAPLGDVVVDLSLCTGCQCCAQACRGGSLVADDGRDGALVLTFDPSACPACGACVRACPEGAVSLNRAVVVPSPAPGRRALGEVARERQCVSCGKRLAGAPATRVVAARLKTSHPEVAGRLIRGDRCADCLLRDPS